MFVEKPYSDKDNEFAAGDDCDVPLKLCVSNGDLCCNQCWCDGVTATLSPKPLGGSSAESTGGLQIISCYSCSSTDFSFAKINSMSRFLLEIHLFQPGQVMLFAMLQV